MRVVSGSDFGKTYSDGGRARGDLVTVVVRPNGLGFSRLGLSIGKRIARRAVQRNRLRRLTREAFRLRYKSLPEGVDVVVVGQGAPEDWALEALSAELERLVPKALSRVGQPRRSRKRSGKGGGSSKGKSQAKTAGQASKGLDPHSSGTNS